MKKNVEIFPVCKHVVDRLALIHTPINVQFVHLSGSRESLQDWTLRWRALIVWLSNLSPPEK